MSRQSDSLLASTERQKHPTHKHGNLIAVMTLAATVLLGLTAMSAYAAEPGAAMPKPQAHVYIYTVRWVSREGGPAKAYKKFGETYGFEPSTIVVTEGEEVTLTFRNLEGGPDDLHTFTLPAYDIDRSIPPLQTVNVIFKADKAGVFPFHCDNHKPWMSGELIVLPAPAT
ncbi:MAG: cupredoxin domain-containing protein [Gammaproteobacteria bacterium]|nr:cupredoxin domain-containing protein [Gammaproteobacteria bacterium]MDE1887911.1 cupredoxin domain-containing protein [Gammaproteobacteria bacterium]MDE2023393.1 cupredoxin domain-containing protein [Gammaproteobacteria bacterium]MDE2138889.1 cupredoxin domain-containing protein [Gammaproteobacteria bacterium]MDE2274541.1 cupredoxin domain-containing protein [Gammaproteobacteria bacterium]